MDNIISELQLQIDNSIKLNCVPVGSVIVNNGKIISSGHNEKEKSKCSVDHAEIIAIQNACKQRKDWRLDDCELYVTLHPCLMCVGAAREARIKKIYYFVDNLSNKNDCKYHFDNIEMIKLEDKYDFGNKLKDFFKIRR